MNWMPSVGRGDWQRIIGLSLLCKVLIRVKAAEVLPRMCQYA